MRSRRFFDYRFSVGVIVIVIGVVTFGFAFYMIGLFIEKFVLGSVELSEFVFIVAGGASMCIGSLWAIIVMCNKTMSWITVTENQIIWRCPLHRTVRMKLDDCVYIGVDDMADHNKTMPVVRGDELTYIYFLSEPFPPKYRHKIDSLKCKKGSIKFAYSDKLCEQLMCVFPKERIKNVLTFYDLMQARDRMWKQKEKRRRK